MIILLRLKMNDLEQYIKLYFGIKEDSMQLVMDNFYEETIEKGKSILKSGQFCNKMSFIRDGFIRIFLERNDRETTQWISSKGYFITDLSSFMFDTRAQWNMESLTSCQLYSIDKKNYAKLIDQVPDWHEIEKKFIAGCFLTLENRVFNHLSLSAEERYNQFFHENKEMFNQVPLHYIASMLGMTPETLSRIRKKQNLI